MALWNILCCASFLLIHGVINATAQCEPRNLLGPDELPSGRPYVPGQQGPSGGIGGVYCATNDVHPLWQLKSIAVKSKNTIISVNISYDVSADPHAASLPNPFPRRCGGD